MASSVPAGMGALPVVLDVAVASLDILLGYWIFKYGRVLLRPPATKMALLPDNFGVLDHLQPINPLSDPINALSQPLNTLSTLVFGWNSPYGVLPLVWGYESILKECAQAYRDGLPMGDYPSPPYTCQPVYSPTLDAITGWYISDFSWTPPGSGKPARFGRYFQLGWNAGGTIIFKDYQ